MLKCSKNNLKFPGTKFCEGQFCESFLEYSRILKFQHKFFKISWLFDRHMLKLPLYYEKVVTQLTTIQIKYSNI
jgi:hypothetical protein